MKEIFIQIMLAFVIKYSRGLLFDLFKYSIWKELYLELKFRLTILLDE